MGGVVGEEWVGWQDRSGWGGRRGVGGVVGEEWVGWQERSGGGGRRGVGGVVGEEGVCKLRTYLAHT